MGKDRRACLALVASLLAAGCSPLGMFDTLVPKDGGSGRVASAVAYGDAPRQKLDVYAPRAKSTGRRPVVVFFYGGSWNSGSRFGYAFVGRALAAQGFVVVIPDYRLVPDVRYPALIEDGAAAVRWTETHVAELGGDPGRLVLMGHSAGAYIAAMLAVDDRWLKEDRKAIKGFVGLAGPYDFTPFDAEASRAAFGGWPRPYETQPVTWAGAGDPPALLLVGADDTTVRPRNSEALAANLRVGGGSADLRLYRKTGHVGLILAIARPFRGKATVLQDVASFVRQVE